MYTQYTNQLLSIIICLTLVNFYLLLGKALLNHHSYRDSLYFSTIFSHTPISLQIPSVSRFSPYDHSTKKKIASYLHSLTRCEFCCYFVGQIKYFDAFFIKPKYSNQYKNEKVYLCVALSFKNEVEVGMYLEFCFRDFGAVFVKSSSEI
jgi:hypothetical protein